MDGDVAHGNSGKIILQRLPVVAVIEAEEYAEFGPSVKHIFADGVFTYAIHIRAFRDAVHRELPCCATVMRAIDVKA